MDQYTINSLTNAAEWLEAEAADVEENLATATMRGVPDEYCKLIRDRCVDLRSSASVIRNQLAFKRSMGEKK